MLANLLAVAGVKHVITVDLHASQMQGFFRCPVDNLHAEPIIARWIRRNVPNWKEAVVVSKNAGGTKRVTSLADALKVNFGIVTTDRKRGSNMSASMIMNHLDGFDRQPTLMSSNRRHAYQISDDLDFSHRFMAARPPSSNGIPIAMPPFALSMRPTPRSPIAAPHASSPAVGPTVSSQRRANAATPLRTTAETGSPLVRDRSSVYESPVEEHGPTDEEDYQDADAEDEEDAEGLGESLLGRTPTNRPMPDPFHNDQLVKEVTHGRLVEGHIVEDGFPSPTISATGGDGSLADDDPMFQSHASSFFGGRGGEGSANGNPGHGHRYASSIATADDRAAASSRAGANSSDEDEDEKIGEPGVEHMITLVGNVKQRTVFILDDMIDKPGSWIAAAETVRKRGFAKKVYAIATHAVFGGDCLQQLQACDCIDQVVVTNSFPIPPEKAREASKLVVLDLSPMLAEAIRRNHYGESMSRLFEHDAE